MRVASFGENIGKMLSMLSLTRVDIWSFGGSTRIVEISEGILRIDNEYRRNENENCIVESENQLTERKNYGLKSQ